MDNILKHDTADTVPFVAIICSPSTDLGTDFLMPGGTNPAVVTFLASPSVINGHTECVNISIVDDADYEGDQQFSVGFYEVTGPVSASGTVSVTIIDNGGNNSHHYYMLIESDSLTLPSSLNVYRCYSDN